MEEQTQQFAEEPVEQKKSKWLFWLVFILILGGLGITIYFLLSSGSDGGILSNWGGTPSPTIA